MTTFGAALLLVWLGLVLGISFLEAPLKFGAPGVTLPIGLAIGRRVFRALNAVEALLAVVVGLMLVVGDPTTTGVAAYVVVVLVLAAQLVAVRPALTRRSDAVLAGEEGPRSRAHLGYVALELVKVVALVVAASALLP